MTCHVITQVNVCLIIYGFERFISLKVFDFLGRSNQKIKDKHTQQAEISE